MVNFTANLNIDQTLTIIQNPNAQARTDTITGVETIEFTTTNDLITINNNINPGINEIININTNTGNDTIFGDFASTDDTSSITLTPGNDYINGGEGTNTIHAGAGNDIIEVAGNNETDIIYTGDGTDTIIINDGSNMQLQDFKAGEGGDILDFTRIAGIEQVAEYNGETNSENMRVEIEINLGNAMIEITFANQQTVNALTAHNINQNPYTDKNTNF